MNPSIFADKGELLAILRNVNYTLYHAENKQLYNNRYGPLVYLHPEQDPFLRTTNFLLRLDYDLKVSSHFLIDTSKLDIAPVWEFVGLEDARLVRWGGILYAIGVRRDVKDNGEGRMEFQRLEFTDPITLEEVERHRIAPPNDPDSYCEKNWMPVIDQPYTFVKWTNPTEVVEVDLKENTSRTTYLSGNTLPGFGDLRGSSQVIPYKNHYVTIVHECDLFQNKMHQKDATYMHRWIVWDREWNLLHISDPWSFMDGEIEFCCGLCEWKGDFLVSFGFQDNAAFVLRIPGNMISQVVKFDSF